MVTKIVLNIRKKLTKKESRRIDQLRKTLSMLKWEIQLKKSLINKMIK